MIVRSIAAGLFSTSPTNRTSPVRPPSAIATACFFLATSNATNTSLYSPMARPPCVRIGSAHPSNPRLLSHESAGHRSQPRNMTSSVASILYPLRLGNWCTAIEQPVNRRHSSLCYGQTGNRNATIEQLKRAASPIRSSLETTNMNLAYTDLSFFPPYRVQDVGLNPGFSSPTWKRPPFLGFYRELQSESGRRDALCNQTTLSAAIIR
ncbi:hypothetical protein MPLB_1490062 [Mesorhizobium sp. ORS 3324]|nr:hypothetical protein MPLB_1490062 [Mesorhizobium sp. ORS 3324]